MCWSSTLVAFDFDLTIANGNTDIAAQNLLPFGKKFSTTVKETKWNIHMGKIFELLHSNSINVTQIINAITNIPPVLAIDMLLKILYSRGCKIIIISDSNVLFISEWLKSKNLSYVISDIFANHAEISNDGLIKLEMYDIQDSCKFCSVSSCKGQILKDYIKNNSPAGKGFDRVVYVGDGSNDLCPIVGLSSHDIAFPRENYALIKMINYLVENKQLSEIKAHVFPWSNGSQILHKLDQEIGLDNSSLDKNK